MMLVSKIKRQVGRTFFGVVIVALASLAIAERVLSQQSITYTYDKLNRLTGVFYSGGASIIYTYDKAGNRSSLQVTGGNSHPTIVKLSPVSASAGTTGLVLIVNGGNFLNNSIVQWNGVNRTTTFISNTQLNASITTADLTASGTANITVLNPGNMLSNAVAFIISTAATPTPTSSPGPTPSNFADLSVSTTVSADAILINNNVSFTSTVKNAGPSRASNTIFVSTLPLGLEVVSVTASQGLCSVNTNADFQFMKLDLPTARIPDRLPSDMPLEEAGNTVTQNYIGGSNRGQYQATRQFVTTRTLDAAIALYNDYFTSHGWPIVATSSLGNLRASAALKDGVLIQATISGNSLSSVRTIDLSLSSGGLVCNLGDVTANSSATITTIVNPTGPGALVNKANIFSDLMDPNLVNNFTVTNVAVLPTSAPFLFTEENTARAVALDSVNMMRDPMALSVPNNFSIDRRTRVALFAANVNLLPGESLSVLTAQAEDSELKVYPMAVEYAGKVAGFNWLTQIVVRLPENLPAGTDVRVSISFRGVVSNKVLLGLKP
jgi:uncharacterized repeat protein (TIGR01451 family)